MSSERFLFAAVSHLHNFDHEVTVDYNGTEIKALALVSMVTEYLFTVININLDNSYLLGRTT